MTWIASLHGDATQLGEDAAAAEAKVRDALQTIADALVGDGHVGVAATFHGSTTGDVNLLQPDAPTDPGPPVTGTPVISEPTEAPDPTTLGEPNAGVGEPSAPDAPSGETAATDPGADGPA